MRELILEPGRAERQYWRDLWHFRELFYFLAWRDLLVRYKQTVIGMAWALVRPLLTVAALTVTFGKIAGLPTQGTEPYVLLVFAGTLPWQFFATAMSEASNSLIGNANLISKIYFPRLVVPASSVITALVDGLISAVFLALMMMWYRYWPDWRVTTLPLFLGLAFGVALGTGLWLAALNVAYRDFRYIVPFIVQFGVFVSPVGMSSSLVLDRWPTLYPLYVLNPLVGVIDGFRWALLRGGVDLIPSLGPAVGMAALLVVSGLWYFRKMERTFADII